MLRAEVFWELIKVSTCLFPKITLVLTKTPLTAWSVVKDQIYQHYQIKPT